MHKAKQNTGLLFNVLRSLLGQAGATSFASDTQNALDQNLYVSKMTGILKWRNLLKVLVGSRRGWGSSSNLTNLSKIPLSHW